MAIDAGTIYSSVELRTGALKGGVNRASGLLSIFSKNSKKQAGIISRAFSTTFGTIAKGAAVIGGLTFALKAAAGPFKDFEQTMANVQSVTRASSEDFQLLEDAARNAGETTRFKASQAADALYFLGSAGFSAKQSVSALDGVLQLAGATQSDLAFTSETVASVISQYGLKAEEASRISNTFAAAIQNSQATMEKLSFAMQQVGPVAAGLGISLEETTGALQVLFNAGFRGQKAGRALKSALADLSSPTANVKENLDKLGVSLESVNPETNSLAEIIDTLSQSGITTAQTIDTFGKVAGPQLSVLISKGRKEIEKYTEAVTGTNAAAESYAIQNDTLAGDLDKLSSKAESVAISFGEQYSPALRDVVQNLTELIGALKPVIDVVGQVSGAFLNFVSIGIQGLTDLVNHVIGVAEEYEVLNFRASQVETQYKKEKESIDQLVNEYSNLEEKQKAGIDQTDEMKGILTRINRIWPDSVKNTGDQALAYGELARQLAKVNEVQQARGVQEIRIKRIEDLNKSLERNSKKYEDSYRDFTRFLRDVEDAEALSLSEISNIDTEQRINAIETALGAPIEKIQETLAISNEEIDKILSLPANKFQLLFRDAEGSLRALLEQASRIEEIESLNKDLENTQKYIENIANTDVEINIETNLPGDSKPSIGISNEEVEETEENADKISNIVENAQEKMKESREKANLESLNGIKQYAEDVNSVISELGNALIGLSQATTDKRLAELERERQARLESAGVTEKTEKERIEEELQAAIKANDQQTVDEKKQELERLKINEDFEKKAAKIKYKAAIEEWQMKLALTIADAARSIAVAAASAPWPFNLVPIGFATAVGGLQLATVSQAKPEPPKFETGGIIPGTGSTDNVNVIAKPEERLLTKEDQRVLTDVLKSGRISDGGQMNLTIITQQNDEEVARRVVKVINNGIVTIDSDRGIR
jgi:TP901 family phage tail tape measure protein